METVTQNSVKQRDFSTLSASEIALIVANNTLLEKQNAELKNQHAALENKQQELLQKIHWFEEQFKLLRHQKFASSSEKLSHLSDIQAQLFDEGAEMLEAEGDGDQDQNQHPQQAEAGQAPETEKIIYTRLKPKRKNRNIDTSQLPREKCYLDLSDEEKRCSCGCCLEQIGEDIKEVIEYKSATTKVIEYIRLKYTCRHCETIKTAPAIESPIPKSKASASLLTEIIINKYRFHLPLYRQSKMLKQYGLDVPDNTLGGWVMQSAAQLEPLGEALWKAINETHALQADETPVKVLEPEQKGYMWLYHSYLPGKRFVMFEFSLSRSADVVNTRLKGFKGLLQTDGYSGYNTQRARTDIVSLGCWDHARRKFADVVKVCGKNKMGKAGEMLKKIGQLYEIEREIKDLTPDERKAIRQSKAKPKLESLQGYLNKINAPPKSLLGQAVTYCKNQWADLTRYVDYGEAQLSNCWVENQVRPFAVGKRNWLFVGNEESAGRAALLYSLIQSSELNEIDPRAYLEYVLGQVHNMRRKTVDPASLLPHRINKQLLQNSALC